MALEKISAKFPFVSARSFHLSKRSKNKKTAAAANTGDREECIKELIYAQIKEQEERLLCFFRDHVLSLWSGS